MIRFLLRTLGLLLLALAFIFVIYDGVKSIADSTLYMTGFGQVWTEMHASSLDSFRVATTQHVPAAWPYVVIGLLNPPAAAVFAVLAVILMLLGRKKKPLIGYARN